MTVLLVSFAGQPMSCISSSPTTIPSTTSTILHYSGTLYQSNTSKGIQPTHTPTGSTGGDDIASLRSRTWPWVVVALVLVLVPACVLSAISVLVWYRRHKQQKSKVQAPSGIRETSLIQTSGSHESTVSVHLRERKVYILYMDNLELLQLHILISIISIHRLIATPSTK